jgi:hypothetical protein
MNLQLGGVKLNQMSGSTPFKIKYQVADLLVAPKGTSNVLGNLSKGAVVLVIEDSDPYYFKVQLDNGLAGYIYKAAGEIVQGASLSKLSPIDSPAPAEAATKPVPTRSANGSSTPTVAARAPRQAAPKSAPASTSSNSSSNSRRESSGPATKVSSAAIISVTSAEIAVYDKPGIIGRQIAKMRRGELAGLLADDGYFFQIQLSTGVIGYIPRYAAEKK